MLSIDLTGKRAFVAGIADDWGFGFAIARRLAEAGASVVAGTWPPAFGIFTKMLERGKIGDSLRLPSGGTLAFERILPLDAEWDQLADVPTELRENRRYKEHDDFTIQGAADRLVAEFGPKPVDIVVHSIANGSEVKNALLDTSRRGYLSALSASAYSFVALVQRFGPILRPAGAFLCLSYMAAVARHHPLAFEAGRRFGARVNAISAGPWASRAASAIGFIEKMIDFTKRNSPLPEPIDADEVGTTAAFLCSPLASGVTGTTVYVDKGYHAMGVAVDGGGGGEPSPG